DLRRQARDPRPAPRPSDGLVSEDRRRVARPRLVPRRDHGADFSLTGTCASKPRLQDQRRHRLALPADVPTAPGEAAPALLRDEQVAVPHERAVRRLVEGVAAAERLLLTEDLVEQLSGGAAVLVRRLLLGQNLVTEVAVQGL